MLALRLPGCPLRKNIDLSITPFAVSGTYRWRPRTVPNDRVYGALLLES